MYLEAVTVCINYSDFLAWTIPASKNLFNYYVVVTSPEDKKTQALCEHYNVHCVATNEMFESGKEGFNKGRAINIGLEKLSKKDFVLHLDADIYVPPNSRRLLDCLPLDPTCIYGADRQMCPNFEKWAEYLKEPRSYQSDLYLWADAFPMGVRIVRASEGYIPIGFFQMFSPSGSKVTQYPEEHAIDRTDMQFAKLWEPAKRRLLAEVVTIHLESEQVKMGANWQGRKTKPFGIESEKKANLFTRMKSILR